MKFKIEISTDNAAFESDGLGPEIAAILSTAATRVRSQAPEIGLPMRLFDSNGNRVGFAVLTEESE